MRISYDNVVIYRLKNISWVGMESLSNVRFAHSSGGSGVVGEGMRTPSLAYSFPSHTHPLPDPPAYSTSKDNNVCVFFGFYRHRWIHHMPDR